MKIVHFQIDVEGFHRKSNKFEFKKVLGWNKIDLCKFAQNMDSYMMVKEHLLTINQYFNGVLHPCPYDRFFFEKVNFLRQMQLTDGSSIFPDGDLRVSVRFYNNRQNNILFFQVTWKQKNVKRATF